MKIYFDKIPLNEEEQPPKSLTINGKNSTSLDFAIDSSSALVRQNKNTNFAISIVIEREHESENDALIFATTHQLQLNCKSCATLEFYNDANDNKQPFFTAENIALQSLSISIDARASTSKYIFIGTII